MTYLRETRRLLKWAAAVIVARLRILCGPGASADRDILGHWMSGAGPYNYQQFPSMPPET